MGDFLFRTLTLILIRRWKLTEINQNYQMFIQFILYLKLELPLLTFKRDLMNQISHFKFVHLTNIYPLKMKLTDLFLNTSYSLTF